MSPLQSVSYTHLDVYKRQSSDDPRNITFINIIHILSLYYNIYYRSELSKNHVRFSNFVWAVIHKGSLIDGFFDQVNYVIGRKKSLENEILNYNFNRR